VDLDVALAALAGCRTAGIGTEYGVRVHELLSGLVVGRILLPGPASDCPDLTVKRTPTGSRKFAENNVLKGAKFITNSSALASVVTLINSRRDSSAPPYEGVGG
jgi:hypothetical protein